MGCKYRFNNKVYNSYQSLIEEFSDGDIQSALAILYSLEHDKQTLLYDKLDKLKRFLFFFVGLFIISVKF